MRTVLALLLLVATPALAEGPARPVVAIYPPAATAAELSGLATLVAARASELVEATGAYTELHAKQVASMMEHEGLSGPKPPKGALDSARRALGADRLASFALTAKGGAIQLSGVVVQAKAQARFSATLPKDWPGALRAGSEAVAQALVAAEKTPLPASAPALDSDSEPALRALAACLPVVHRQPLGLGAPAVIDAPELADAAARCGEAIEADPKLAYARGALALAHAIAGEDQPAAKSLARLEDGASAVETATLARFWLVTRYQSSEAGLALLEAMEQAQPGELILRAYHAETHMALGQNEKALEAWDAYLARAPASPFAHGQRSRVLGRLERHDEALAAARRAVELHPEGRDARLQLGGRLLDAGRVDEAVAVLAALVALPGVRGEHALRLAYAYLAKGKLDDAAKLVGRALELSTRPADWRTRGRAYYDLAIVEARRGRMVQAREALRSAREAGYRNARVDPSLVPLEAEAATAPAPAADKAAPASAPAQGAKGARLQLDLRPPRESSLFKLDPFGAPDPNAARPPPPEGMVLFRF